MIKDCSWCGKLFRANNNKRRFCGVEHYREHQKLSRNMGSYRKGCIPWNKGRKGVHYSPETEFKKGQIGINHLPVGSIRIRKRYSRNNASKRWIKISEPNIWQLYATYLWTKEIGEVPTNYLVHHINHDSLDDRLDNLALVTRAQHINLHRGELLEGRKTDDPHPGKGYVRTVKQRLAQEILI